MDCAAIFMNDCHALGDRPPKINNRLKNIKIITYLKQFGNCFYFLLLVVRLL